MPEYDDGETKQVLAVMAFDVGAEIKRRLSPTNIPKPTIQKIIDETGVALKSIIKKELGVSLHEESMSESAAGDAAERLLKDLEKDVFAERTVTLGTARKRMWRGEHVMEYPLNFKIGDFDVGGKVVEIPHEARKGVFVGDPEKGLAADPGEEFPVPEGHTVYAWHAVATLPHEQIGKALNTAQRIGSAFKKDVKQELKGKVIKAISKAETDPEGDQPISLSRGVFASPLSPEELKGHLSEKLGIRSIIPGQGMREDSANASLKGVLDSLEL